MSRKRGCRLSRRSRSRSWAAGEAAQEWAAGRGERDRVRAGDDQVTAAGEAVRVETATAGDEPLGAVQVGQVDTVAVGGERERVRAEGDAPAVARVEAARPPDDPAVEKKEKASHTGAADVEVGAVAAAGSVAMSGEPVPGQPADLAVGCELEAAAARPEHERCRHRWSARKRC